MKQTLPDTSDQLAFGDQPSPLVATSLTRLVMPVANTASHEAQCAVQQSCAQNPSWIWMDLQVVHSVQHCIFAPHSVEYQGTPKTAEAPQSEIQNHDYSHV